MKPTFRYLKTVLVGAWLLSLATPAGAETITFWSHWNHQQAVAVVNTIIPAFKADTGIDVDFAIARPMNEKLTLATAAGTAPDVIVVKSTNLAALANAGLIQPIERYVAGSSLIRREYYDPITWSIGQWNGHTYGVPAVEVGPIGALIFRKDLFSAAGLEPAPPTTVDALRQYHRKLTTFDGSGKLLSIGFHPMMSLDGGAALWGSMYDINWYDAATNRINLTTEKSLAMVEDIRYYMQYAGLDAPGTNRYPFGDWTGGFASGKVGMMLTGYYSVGELSRMENVSEADYGYGFVPTPTGEKWILPKGWMLAIPSGAKNPDAGFRFIERFIDGEGPRAIWDTQGWLNGNLRFMRTLPIERSSGIWFFIESTTKADRLGAFPQFPEFEEVVAQWTNAVWSSIYRETTPMEALSNVERQFNNK